MLMAKGKKKPETQVSQERNKDKELIPIGLASEVVQAVGAKKGYGKRDRFLLGWILGLPAATAGRMAGYSETYSLKLSAEAKKSPKMLERLAENSGAMPERYKMLCRLRLGDVAAIEGAALAEMKENPRLALEKPQILRQVKAAAGALADDSVNVQVVSIGTLNLLQAHVSSKLEARSALGQIVDVDSK
jgi:hypothetical protein